MSATIRNMPERAEDAMAQIVRLRAEVETLMRDRVTPAVTGVAERMASAAQDTVETVRTQADKLSGRVRGQPLTSIIIAVAIGYLMGRLAH
jgi:ElaB/YqjD/DUF883 family membrane-anchored ribosome-binding protein